jgi:acetylornithine deacetylase
MDHISNICNWIDENSMKLINFCKDYVKINSVTGNELQVQKWIKMQMKKVSFTKVDYFALDSKGIRPNVVGIIKGSGGGESLIINGHTDTVPVKDIELKLWNSNPWEPIIKDNKIYGRGVSDMKGGISAALFAVEAIIENNIQLKGDLILEVVVGEELGEHEIGTTGVTKRGYKAPFAIVAEPTNCEIHTICPGAITWQLFVKGKAVHAGQQNKITYPQRYGLEDGEKVGVDAFKKALKILNAWEFLEKEWNFRWKNPTLGGGGLTYDEKAKSDVEGVGFFGITPAIIESGDYVVAVPGFARIRGGLYHPNWIKGEEVIKEMNEVINAVSKYDDWLKVNPPELKAELYWGPSVINKDHNGVKTLAKCLFEVTREDPIYSGFAAASDSTWLYEQGIPTVVFGPGSLSITAAKVYVKTILEWCNYNK